MGASAVARVETAAGGIPSGPRPTVGPGQRFLSAPFRDCPVKVTVGVLGKKWTLRILGQIAVYGRDRFNLLLTALPGITPKVLATQLNDLQAAGLLERVTRGTAPRRVRWALTARGHDAVAILIVMTGFASKYYPELLYDDEKPRRLREIVDQEGAGMIQALLKGR